MSKTLTAAALAVALVAIVFSAPAATAEPQCMEYYSKKEIGPVTIESRDSCTHDVYLNGELVRPTFTNALGLPGLPTVDCYAIYNEYHAGPVTIIQTSSCSATVTAAVAPTALVPWRKLGLEEPMCLAVYHRIDVGPASLIMSCGVGVIVRAGPGAPAELAEDAQALISHYTRDLISVGSAGVGLPEGLDANPLDDGCVGYTPPYTDDAGDAWCVEPDGPCYVKHVQMTIAGPRETCIGGSSGGETSAFGLPSLDRLPPVDLYCYAISNTYRAGPVTVYQQSSCEYDVAGYVAPPPPFNTCYSIGNTWYLGPLTLRQHSSCSYSFYLDSGYVLP